MFEDFTVSLDESVCQVLGKSGLDSVCARLFELGIHRETKDDNSISFRGSDIQIQKARTFILSKYIEYLSSTCHKNTKEGKDRMPGTPTSEPGGLYHKEYVSTKVRPTEETGVAPEKKSVGCLTELSLRPDEDEPGAACNELSNPRRPTPVCRVPEPMFSPEQSDLMSVTYPVDSLVLETPNGPTILVYKTNLTTLTIDAIVNPCGKKVGEGGSLSKAISESAGVGYQRACRDKAKSHGDMLESEVVVTSAGNLPCKIVLHAHSPVWHKGSDQKQTEYNLKRTIGNCIYMADDAGVRSVALPAMSAGTDIFSSKYFQE